MTQVEKMSFGGSLMGECSVELTVWFALPQGQWVGVLLEPRGRPPVGMRGPGRGFKVSRSKGPGCAR